MLALKIAFPTLLTLVFIAILWEKFSGQRRCNELLQ